MTTLRPFTVVVVPFPYADHLAEKRRPALVVSSEQMLVTGRFWAAMITSSPKAEFIGDAEIVDLDAAGLPKVSLVRASKLSSIDARRIVRATGELAVSDRVAAQQALRACAAFLPMES